MPITSRDHAGPHRPRRPAIMRFKVRDARTGDLPFLRKMLYEAAFWRPGIARPPLKEGLARPEFAKLLRGWGRAGDAAVVAKLSGGRKIGAAWYRFWSERDHSFGFVAPGVPELGMAVSREHRGRGVGSALLSALVDRARWAALGRISLSVEKDNPALNLYKRHGFKKVGSLGNAWTMARRVAPARHGATWGSSSQGPGDSASGRGSGGRGLAKGPSRRRS